MTQRSHIRLVILQVLVLSLVVTLFGRLWYLQVMASERYQRAAADNRLRELVTPATRGLIIGSDGATLVTNRTALVVSVSRSDLLRQPDEGEAVLRRLADTLEGITYQGLKERIQLCDEDVPQPCWNGSPYAPIPVTDQASTSAALQIMERREAFPGVTAEIQPVRTYPSSKGVNAAHVLGYLGPVSQAELEERRGAGADAAFAFGALVGRSGLEQEYDAALRGHPGLTTVAVDHLGRVTSKATVDPPTPGNHLVTSINAELQNVVERELHNAIERARGTWDDNTHRNFEGDAGAAVVLDVRTGHVLAMANYPSYDPSVWVGGISQNQYGKLTSGRSNYPLVPRATQGEFAPASTFKIISTAAAAKEGFPLNGDYSCPAAVSVGGQTFNNYIPSNMGNMDFAGALRLSCDTVYYQIAYQMWLRQGGNDPEKGVEDPILKMAKGFGLGRPSGIDLPTESDGQIADREFKRDRWKRMKDYWCRMAKVGFPDVAKDDPARASYLKTLMHENCLDGDRYRAGDAVIQSIGQGETTVTPLQLAVAYAALANGGTLWEPRIGRAVMSPTGRVVKTIEPERAGQVPIGDGVLRYIRTALASTSVSGTAAGVFAGFPLDEIPVGAKTGTGEVYGKQTTSWFATFAPADKPRYAVVMMVSQGGFGSTTSGPSVRKIYEAIFGVTGAGIRPDKAIFPDGPPKELPEIRDDGTVVGPEDGP
ncbi:MAG: penicillin-binding protein 2 [Carbonactinosporaceae bacterium]